MDLMDLYLEILRTLPTTSVQHTVHQIRAAFANGYTASIIDNGYGADKGLFELAVVYNGEIDYTTPITNDVVGFLTGPKAIELCKEIAALPAKTKWAAIWEGIL